MIKRNKISRAAVYILAFAIPAGVMLSAYAAMGMFPWGDKSILISDMASQYVEFFCALKRGDVFFSWSKTMGTNYVGVFSYYVSSPLSVLTLLVPNENMPVGLMFLTVLKLGLAGLAYGAYSMRRFPGAEITSVLCASCYGLMSYNIAFSMSIMWLDGVIWLPLILLALERVLAGKSAGPFIAALTVCFVSTWYISYMIGIFCCVYLAVRLVGLKPDRAALFRVLGRFFGGAVCALGLTAWLWLPTLLSMSYGKLQEGSVHLSGIAYGPLTDVLGQLRPGQLTTITNSGLPNIYCGTVVVALAVIWFLLPGIPLRETLAGALALMFLFLSMWSTLLDKVWHLFQYPNWFPYRYSFVVSFFLIYLANQALPGLREAFKGKMRPMLARGLAAALLLFTVAELHYNTETLLAVLDETFSYRSYEGYRSYYTSNATLVDEARSDGGGEFWRMNSTQDRGSNAPLSFGYPGITHYSSIYNMQVNALLYNLGMAQDWYWSSGYGSTPVTDALLGVRYVISRDAFPPGYEAIADVEGLRLWKNPDALPLAFFASGGVEALTGETPFQRQNGVLSALTGEQVTVFAPVEAAAEVRPGETTYTVAGIGKPLYMDLSADGLQEVLVNGERVLTLGYSEAACVHYLGIPAAGETWTVSVRGQTIWAGQVWALDQAALQEALERVNRAQVTSVEKNGRVRLTVETDRRQTLAATIPAEDGWRAYVDGVPVRTSAWLNAFLSLEVPAGTHEVELRFTAPGLAPGLVLGLISAAGLAMVYTKRNLSGQKYEKKRKSVP